MLQSQELHPSTDFHDIEKIKEMFFLFFYNVISGLVERLLKEGQALRLLHLDRTKRPILIGIECVHSARSFLVAQCVHF